MAIPTYEELMLPCLRLHLDGPKTVPQMIPTIVSEFMLTDEERDELLDSGRQTRLSNRLHWSRIYMTRAGLLERISRGLYQITNRGLEICESERDFIDKDFLTQFEEFNDFLSRDRAPQEAIDETSEDLEKKSTPQETISAAVKELSSALASDLLDSVLDLTPTAFEQLVIDLLSAMGYGGGDPAQGKRLGRSGDGGIDGIVKEDKLGLDAIYVQAKRYKVGNNIGRPDVQGFVGSMTGEGATKGVFVTTSNFTKEAVDYSTRISQRVVLIDGTALARLMIEHDVGVRTETVYRLKAIDLDYFEST